MDAESKSKQSGRIKLPVEFVTPFSLSECIERLKHITNWIEPYSVTFHSTKIQITMLSAGEDKQPFRMYSYSRHIRSSSDLEIDGYLQQAPNQMTRVVLESAKAGRQSRGELIFYTLLILGMDGCLLIMPMKDSNLLVIGFVTLFFGVLLAAMLYELVYPSTGRYVSLIHKALTYIPPQETQAKPQRRTSGLLYAIRFIDNIQRIFKR